MTKKTKTERIFESLISGERLSGKSMLQKFGTMKGGNRINELESKYDFKCRRLWILPSKNSDGRGAYYNMYSMNPEDQKKFKRLIKL